MLLSSKDYRGETAADLASRAGHGTIAVELHRCKSGRSKLSACPIPNKPSGDVEAALAAARAQADASMAALLKEEEMAGPKGGGSRAGGRLGKGTAAKGNTG